MAGSRAGYSNDDRLAENREAVEARQPKSNGPTIEEFVDAGYLAANYPPAGYAVVDSHGWQVEAKRRAREARMLNGGTGSVADPQREALANSGAQSDPLAASTADRRENDLADLTVAEQRETGDGAPE